MNAIDGLRTLDSRRATLIADAKTEALEGIATYIDTLRQLGFEYSLVQKPEKKSRPTTRPRGQTGKAQGACPICEFKTDPPHDRRHHRTQDPKLPFLAEELAAKGLVKIEPDIRSESILPFMPEDA